MVVNFHEFGEIKIWWTHFLYSWATVILIEPDIQYLSFNFNKNVFYKFSTLKFIVQFDFIMTCFTLKISNLKISVSLSQIFFSVS